MTPVQFFWNDARKHISGKQLEKNFTELFYLTVPECNRRPMHEPYISLLVWRWEVMRERSQGNKILHVNWS